MNKRNKMLKDLESDVRLLSICFIVEKLFNLVNMTWVEVLSPLYILVAFYIFCFIFKIKFWEA